MLLLLLLGLVTSVRADCEVCITGICHSKNNLIPGYHVNDQLALDRTNNIIYTILGYNQIVALHLNGPNASITLIQNTSTSGMVVDPNTQDLYTSRFEIVYRYKYKHNYSIDSFTLGHHIAYKLSYDDTLYMITPAGTFVYLNKTTGAADENHLKDYELQDFVKVNATSFFIANDDVYKFDWNDGTTQLICKNKQVISTDKYGDIYFVDNPQKKIYKRDKSTGKLELYASWKSGSITYFVFDKDNNIIFRDTDDEVLQWVPGNTACINSQPQEVCHIKEDEM